MKLSAKRSLAPPAATQVDQQEPDRPNSLPGVIKDQLILLGFLVLLIGIISTETYYSVFGVKYQFLSLPSFHLIYRGLTSLFDAPILLVVYIGAALWLLLDLSATARSWRRFLQFRVVLTYVFLLALLLISYAGARLAGRRAAEHDLIEQTCSLPRIVNLKTAKGENIGFDKKYRLFMVDTSYVLVFKPVDPTEGDGQSLENTIPKMKRIKKDELDIFETSR